jgi:hypothetical protein
LTFRCFVLGCTESWTVRKARREASNYEELAKDMRQELGELTGCAVDIPDSEGVFFERIFYDLHGKFMI